VKTTSDQPNDDALPEESAATSEHSLSREARPDEPRQPTTGRFAGLRAALSLLVPGFSRPRAWDERMDRPPAAEAASAIHWLVPLGLLMGLIYVGLFRAAWRLFGEVGGVRLMPAVAVWLADAVFLGWYLVYGVARTADSWSSGAKNNWEPEDERSCAARKAETGRPAVGATHGIGLGLVGLVALFAVMLVKLALWTSLPEGISGWPADWRRSLNFAYPRPVFRPLLLAPIWGRWAILLAAGIGRTAPSSAETLPGLSGVRSPLPVLGWFAALLLLTSVYCGRHGRWMIGCVIGLAVLGVTFLFCVVTARRFSGHTRATVFAAGLVSESFFLICYLAASQRIYYY